MRDYVIFTDSCVDYGPEMYEETGVKMDPLTFSLEGKTHANWPDGRDISFKEFYKKLRSGSQASTSQVNVNEFVESFRKELDDGNDILYLGFSSGLSGTVNSGRIAAEELAEDYPDAKIIVVDTLAASLGQGLLVWHAAKRKKEGQSIDEVAQWVEDNKLNLAHWFTVDDLNFLKRGGRIGSAAAMFGTVLQIKPVMHVDNKGFLVPARKVRGRRQSLNALIEHMEKTAIEPEKQTIFISHGDCLDEAEYLAKEIKRKLNVERVYINYVGPVIGSHSGPGTMALFFLAEER